MAPATTAAPASSTPIRNGTTLNSTVTSRPVDSRTKASASDVRPPREHRENHPDLGDCSDVKGGLPSGHGGDARSSAIRPRRRNGPRCRCSTSGVRAARPLSRAASLRGPRQHGRLSPRQPRRRPARRRRRPPARPRPRGAPGSGTTAWRTSIQAPVGEHDDHRAGVEGVVDRHRRERRPGRPPTVATNSTLVGSEASSPSGVRLPTASAASTAPNACDVVSVPAPT